MLFRKCLCGSFIRKWEIVFCHPNLMPYSKSCHYKYNRSKIDLTFQKKAEHKQNGHFCNRDLIFPNKWGK